MTGTDADAALERMLLDGAARASATDTHHAALWDALAAAAAGGKRFRPALLTAVHDALGGGRPAAAAEVGAAVELLHTAFVIHDDVIDGDDVRRGRPNVSGTFRSRAAASGAEADGAAGYGTAAAILAGDLALTAAVRAVALCGAEPVVVRRLLDLFDEALHTTAAGELADVRLALGHTPTSLGESLLMEEQKTSAYSFALPLRAGAVLAGADDATTERLGEVGRATGIAFQLVDDLIGVFGDPTSSGKSATSDLRTGKQTPLLVHARSTPEWSEIAAYVGRDLDPGELDEVRDLLTRAGSRRFVEELADEHLAAARSGVAALGITLELLDAAMTRPPALLVGSEAAA